MIPFARAIAGSRSAAESVTIATRPTRCLLLLADLAGWPR